MDKSISSLIQAILSLETAGEARNFLTDLCTPQELEDLCVRWQIVTEIEKGLSYRAIHEKTDVSISTIGRIAKTMKYGSGGYSLIHQRLKKT